MISYKDVSVRYDKNKGQLDKILNQIEEVLVAGRDCVDKKIPIYATKYRIKSKNSIYLKTKRKKITDLGKINDYAGMRVLCLVEQDIPIINRFIIKSVKQQGWILLGMKTYNFEVEQADQFFEPLHDFDDSIIPIRDYKESGYRSIHYILRLVAIGGQQHTVEIQLRTLLQDVWGELEHSLSYKQGQVNSHIKKSFLLLAQDLSTCDSLMKHLKDIKDLDNAGRLFSLNKGIPYGCLKYEGELLADPFKESGSHEDLYQDYCACLAKRESLKEDSLDSWLEELSEKLNTLTAAVPGQYHDQCDKFRYWKTMEKAYLAFYSGKFDDAKKLYERLKENPKFCNRPVLNFRLGELFFIKDQLENALKCFDLSEQNIIDSMQGNKFRIKVKVSFIYWMLGEEYFPIVIENIDEALSIYENKLDTDEGFADGDYSLITNLMCWYNLDMYIMLSGREKAVKRLVHKYNLNVEETKKKEEEITVLSRESKKYYDDSHKHFKIIEDDFILNQNGTSNVFDTAAWFCYQTYLKEGDSSWLNKAQEYCHNILEKKNGATLLMTSFNTQRSHILEIMNAVTALDSVI